MSRIAVALVALVLVGCQKDPNEFTASDAYMLCEAVIKGMSRDPETASIPFVRNQGNETEYVYVWDRDTRFVRVRNGLGLEVPATVKCAINRATREISEFSMK